MEVEGMHSTNKNGPMPKTLSPIEKAIEPHFSPKPVRRTTSRLLTAEAPSPSPSEPGTESPSHRPVEHSPNRRCESVKQTATTPGKPFITASSVMEFD